jgi:ATP-dependent RNA helicase DeaD
MFLDKIKDVMEEGGLSQYVAAIERLAGEDYASLDIAAALLKMAMGGKAKEAAVQSDEKDFENTGGEPGMVRLFINICRNQNIKPGDIVGGIAGETGIPGKLIGSIDIYDKYTFVEVPREYANDVIKTMKDNQIKGKRINIEPANSKQH